MKKTFQASIDTIRELTGLTFPESRIESVHAIFEKTMVDCHIDTDAALALRIAQDASVRDRVLAQLTVGETYFFRDPEQLNVLRDMILPDVMAHKDEKSVRVWSAAASSGEEAYSVAIILEELGFARDAEIIGTDIARPRLARAQRGRYGKWSMRGVSQQVIDRYFTREGDQFQIAPRFRTRVRFSYLNLAEDEYPSLVRSIYDMDVILCRNVLIYFDAATVARVADRLMRSLNANGWLLLGATDPDITQYVECDVISTPAGLAYRRMRTPRDARTESFTSQPVRTTPSISEMAGSVESAAAAALAELSSAYPELDRIQTPAATQSPLRVEHIADSTSRTAVDAKATVRSLCDRGLTRDAVERAVEALEANSEDAEMQYLLAVALTHEKQIPAAIHALKAAVYVDHNFVIAHVLMGQLYARQGNSDSARRSFRNALRLLESMPPDAEVSGTSGETAARILQTVRAHVRMLGTAA